MTNHTPAPWDVDTDGAIIGRRVKYKEIAAGTSGGGIKIHNDADRYLILAAPDMYEALERARAILDFRNDNRGEIYADICTALKKARGEA